MTTAYANEHAKAPEARHTEPPHPAGYFVRIWGMLVGLLMVSVLGPMLEITLVTLITAFGIAIVKAYLVAKHFMHLTVEKRFVGYLLAACLAFVLLFWAGTAPDVMRHEGTNWQNPSAHPGAKP